jgi:hypothetical protein
VREQMRGATTDVQDPISRLGADELLGKVAPQPFRSHPALHRFVQLRIPESRV